MDDGQRLQFEAELAWCIDQLQIRLESGNLSEKQANDSIKALKSLQNPKAPLPKKRQVMKASLGDYRTKMANEEKNFRLDSTITTEVKPPTASQFFKRHSEGVGCSGGPVEAPSSFKFNFGATSEPKEVVSEPSKKPTNSAVNFSMDNSFRFNFGGS